MRVSKNMSLPYVLHDIDLLVALVSSVKCSTPNLS